MKEKIAFLLSEVARRVWPQQWPDMTTQLMQKAMQSASQCELCLILFRNLAEDAKNFQEINDRRRRDFIIGITNNQDKIIQFMYHSYIEFQLHPPIHPLHPNDYLLMQSFSKTIFFNKKSYSLSIFRLQVSENGQEAQITKKLYEAALDAISSYLELLNIEYKFFSFLFLIFFFLFLPRLGFNTNIIILFFPER